MRRIDPDLRAWIELSLVPGLGPAALHALLRSFGEPAAILHAAPRHLEQAVPPAIVHAILSEDRREAVKSALLLSINCIAVGFGATG